MAENFVRVTTSLRPEILAKMDEICKDMNMTRSGFITYCIEIMDAMDRNKSLNKLVGNIIRQALKREMKP